MMELLLKAQMTQGDMEDDDPRVRNLALQLLSVSMQLLTITPELFVIL